MNIEQIISELVFPQSPSGLYDPIRYALASGGKRIRPLLVEMAAKLYDTPAEKVLPAALALELFHNFTLLHDDLMDHADMRRGRRSVPAQFSDNQAVLSGDEMLIEAYKQLETIPVEYLPEVLRLFNKMGREICEGQQWDMDFETLTPEQVTLENYLNMIRLKTAVLLGTALQMGALLSNTPVEEQTLLYEFGVNIGLAFQLKDDLLDLYGDPDTFGKPIGGDIIEGKKTYLMLTAFPHLTDKDKDLIFNNAYAREERIAAAQHVYARVGAKAATEAQIQTYTQAALTQLAALPVVEDKKKPLYQLVGQLIYRQK